MTRILQSAVRWRDWLLALAVVVAVPATMLPSGFAAMLSAQAPAPAADEPQQEAGNKAEEEPGGSGKPAEAPAPGEQPQEQKGAEEPAEAGGGASTPVDCAVTAWSPWSACDVSVRRLERPRPRARLHPVR